MWPVPCMGFGGMDACLPLACKIALLAPGTPISRVTSNASTFAARAEGSSRARLFHLSASLRRV